MSSSDRQHRISLYQPVLTPDSYGGQKTEYVKETERWAQVMPPGFRDQQAQGAPMSREQIQVKLTPPDSSIKRGWRLCWQGDSYEITAVDNTYRERTLVIAHALKAGV